MNNIMLLRSMFFILFALCSLLMKVQARGGNATFAYCDTTRSYHIHVNFVELHEYDDGTTLSRTNFMSMTKLDLTEADISYEILPPNSPSPYPDKRLLRDNNRVLPMEKYVKPGQNFLVEDSHDYWYWQNKPVIKLKITNPRKAPKVGRTILVCITFLVPELPQER